MFESKTTKILRMRKKNIGSFFAMLFCTLVLVSTIGNSFGIRNSFAQQELQTQQPSTLAWSNDLPTAGNNWHVLCGHGVCNTSSDPSNMSTAASGDPQQQNDNNIQHKNLALTFANTKNLDLAHIFTSAKTIGPDRFRFVQSYWTTPDTANAINVGTSGNAVVGAACVFSAPSTTPNCNPKLEVDTNEGFSTLAVVLQYQGVVQLEGITAAMKLPTGFASTFPLTDDRTRHDIALSSFTGAINPGQGVVLYFPMYVLPTAKVQLPVLGPLALHFLRSAPRAAIDTIGGRFNAGGLATATPAQNNAFSKMLTVTNTAQLPNSTAFTDNFDFARDYFNSFQRDIPFDFINQVIPVIFKVTGQETLDVVTLPTVGTDKLKNISTDIVKIPSDVTTKVRLAVRNTGDVPIWDLTINIQPGLQSSLGINGLTPSAITSPNIPQTLFSSILPIGIVGPSFFGIGELGPNQNAEFDVSVFPTHYVAGTVQLMNINLVYNNIIGIRTQSLTSPGPGLPTAPCCQVYFNVTPNP
jgi:hypothetical protein